MSVTANYSSQRFVIDLSSKSYWISTTASTPEKTAQLSPPPGAAVSLVLQRTSHSEWAATSRQEILISQQYRGKSGTAHLYKYNLITETLADISVQVNPILPNILSLASTTHDEPFLLHRPGIRLPSLATSRNMEALTKRSSHRQDSRHDLILPQSPSINSVVDNKFVPLNYISGDN